MPTDRSMPEVSTTSVCAIATIASSTPLLAAVVATLALRPDRMIGGVDREHHDERREREQRAPVLAQPVRPVAVHDSAACGVPALRAFAPMFSALLISARSVISAPTSSRLIAPSYITSTRSQQPISSS